MANALNEMRGGSVDATIASGDYRCRLDSGEGACRLYVVRPQTAGCTFTLPNPAYIRAGAAPNFTVINKGPEAIAIRSFGGITITTLAVDRAVEIRIPVQGLDVWILQGPFVVSTGAALNGNRLPFEINYTASSASAPTQLRNDIARQYGYVGSDGPAALIVTIKQNVVLGGGSGLTGGFNTNSWPSGTTLLLILESGAIISGRGGNGGIGEPVNAGPVTNGTDGSLALATRIPTAIVNNGRIQGGGGGGGGAARQLVGGVYRRGGSGGGGAGVPAGTGGAAVDGDVATQGANGSLLLGGNGGTSGFYQGGRGGDPGSSGNAGQGPTPPSGLGGFAGAAIGIGSGASVTNILAGIQLGGTTSI